MKLSRRNLLQMAGGAIASSSLICAGSGALAAPAIVGIRELNARTLSFDGYYTGEHLKNVTYWADGDYIPDALTEINHMLRDWRMDEVHPIEPKLLDLLYQLGRGLDTSCQFELVSGYRSPRTNAMLHRTDPGVATNSLHMQGQAIDISLPGTPLKTLHAKALAMQLGGVGYYPDSNFIHVRQWTG
jgi:uncharacterized protein YcbK (DUF882 family)